MTKFHLRAIEQICGRPAILPDLVGQTASAQIDARPPS